MSHFGQGLLFRRAGALAVQQFGSVVGGTFQPFVAAVAGAAMVEAFPNTFMGVLLPDEVLSGIPSGRRGKSDRLYEACLAVGIFERLVDSLGWSVTETMARLGAERDHDIRAAYICLLTAGFAHAGTATVVGDPIGGWFWLPPMLFWADWAKAALSLSLAAVRKKGYSDVDVFSIFGAN